MNLLLAPWRSLVGFWTTPIRAEPLAAFRILLGLAILANQLTGIGPNLAYYCGDEGICPAAAHDHWLSRSHRICVLRGPINMPLLGQWLPDAWARAVPGLSSWVSDEQAQAWAAWGERPENVRLLFGVYLGVLVLVTVGFCTRLSLLAAIVLAATFNNRVVEMMNGGDSLFRNGLYFLLLSPAGACWSVDRWLARRLGWVADDGPVFIAPWSVRLMQIQLAVMYLFTGLVKLSDLHWDNGRLTGDWLDGEALYWVMNDIAVTRWSYAQAPVPLALCRFLTWGTLIFEIGFGLFVLIRPLRLPVLLAGIALHLGIFLSMEIGWFSQITLCWYVLFASGDWLASWVSRPAPRTSPAA